MELAVGELAQVLGQSQPRVSRHVRILCDAGLAERRKEGSWVFLRSAIGEGRAPPLGAAAARAAGRGRARRAAFAARCAEDRRHLAAIRAERASQAPRPISRAMPRNGTRCARCTAPTSRSRPRWPRRWATSIAGRAARCRHRHGPHGRTVRAARQPRHRARQAARKCCASPARGCSSCRPGQVDLVQGDFAALPFADGQRSTPCCSTRCCTMRRNPARCWPKRRACRARRRASPWSISPRTTARNCASRHAHARLGFSDEQMLALLSEAGFDRRPGRGACRARR